MGLPDVSSTSSSAAFASTSGEIIGLDKPAASQWAQGDWTSVAWQACCGMQLAVMTRGHLIGLVSQS
jgi:hypothetical protein